MHIADSEIELDIFISAESYLLRHDIANTVNTLCLNILFVSFLAENISCGALTGSLAFEGNKVNKVVNMKNIAAGKNSGVRSLSELVYHRTACHGIKFDSHVL